ncbi:MAG: hypothetical protein R2867_42170 [Caldilineaceae bacterium]
MRTIPDPRVRVKREIAFDAKSHYTIHEGRMLYRGRPIADFVGRIVSMTDREITLTFTPNDNANAIS